jgi:hypothetical protein
MNIKVMHEQSGTNRNNGGSQPSGAYWYWITSPHTRLRFYFDSVRSSSLMGAGNARQMQFQPQGSGSPPENIDYWLGRVGVCVDLEDSGLSPGQSLDDLFGGTENFRIHIDDADPSP